MSRYVQRLGRIFEALQILDIYRQGVTVAVLAELLGCSERDVRSDLAALNAGSELGPERAGGFVLFLSRLPDSDAEGAAGAGEDGSGASEFDDDDLYVEADAAVAVRLYGPDPRRGIGGLSVTELGAILEAAEDLSRLEPENEPLARVIAEIRSRWLPGVSEVWRPSLDGRFTGELNAAVQQNRRVWIRYERLWQPGIIERVIEPYELVRTQRGFEVDAGSLDGDGSVRTYVVDEIRELRLLDETFERPDDAAQRCADHRRTTSVVVVVPKDREWAAEYLSEAVTVEVRDDDAQLRLDLLEPVVSRLGLIVIQAGPEAFVSDPTQLADAGEVVAARLWEHHQL